jgi:hypothetical protein
MKDLIDDIREFSYTRSFDKLMKEICSINLYMQIPDLWHSGFFMGVIPLFDKDFNMKNKFAFRGESVHRFIITDIGATITG